MHFETFEKYQEFDLIKQKYAVANTDALSALSEINDGFFKLIISTPYCNTGKSYEIKTSIESYLNTREVIISQLLRVLSENGSTWGSKKLCR